MCKNPFMGQVGPGQIGTKMRPFTVYLLIIVDYMNVLLIQKSPDQFPLG